MNELESLRRLTEAVETAKADIAPTYIEYVHLAFAIATDCGEEGRDFSTACAGFPPNTNANTPNGYSPTHSQPIMGICIWARCSISPKRQELPSAKRRLQTAGQVQKVQQVQRKNFPHTRARVIRYTIARVRSLRNCCRVANPNSRYPPSGSRLAGTPATYYELRKYRRTERCHAIGSTDRSGFLHGTVCTVSLWR